ncbi:DUF4229 domain-containing protein [Nocardiopsis aegyptia]|uniref:DUF4229 domain-containing protein n=1 Tax=Nocardiopsis aegyptia TaxID=220378 RepID=UPI003670AABC
MRSWLTYTAARVGLFVGALGVVYLFGARSWIALVLAWLVSGLASYVLLSKLRDQMSASAVKRIEERRGPGVAERLEGGASREDHLQEDGPDTGADEDGRPEAAVKQGEPESREP